MLPPQTAHHQPIAHAATKPADGRESLIDVCVNVNSGWSVSAPKTKRAAIERSPPRPNLFLMSNCRGTVSMTYRIDLENRNRFSQSTMHSFKEAQRPLRVRMRPKGRAAL